MCVAFPHDLLLEFLVSRQSVSTIFVVLAAALRHRVMLGILSALVHHAVFIALLALHVVDVGVVILQQQVL